MYRKLGEGNGLIALTGLFNPNKVIKIPKPGRWTLDEAVEKVDLLDKANQGNCAIAKTRFTPAMKISWRSRRTDSSVFYRKHEYQGWAFVQARVFGILDKYPSLIDVNLEEFVEIHHGLWRMGLGFVSGNELYGMFNKGYNTNGKLLSFDIGSLTSKKELIESQYHNGNFDKKKQEMISGLQKKNTPALVARYQCVVEKYLTLQQFNRLWPI